MATDPYGRETLRPGRMYPITDDEPEKRYADRRTDRVTPTGEFRCPRKGEWYLSGSIIEGYRAPSDLSMPFHIGRLVKGEYVWRPILDTPTMDNRP